MWRTENALGDEPDWKQLKPDQLDQNSVGILAFDPTDKNSNTIYLGTGEGNRCSSGCEAGVGIYKSTNGGDKWTKLGDKCVSNRHVSVRDTRQRCLPRPRDQRDRHRPEQREPHLRRFGAGRSRPVARDRQRRHDPHRAGRQRCRGSTSRPTAAPRSRWSGTAPSRTRDRRRSASPTSGSIRSIPSVVYAAAFDAGLWRRDAGAARRRSPRSSGRSSTRVRGSTG